MKKQINKNNSISDNNNNNNEKNMKNVNSVKIIKEGKKLREKEIEKNKLESKKLIMYIYIIPLVLIVIIGLVYILTQKNLLLIPFAILMFFIMWGWDGSSRVCPHCNKWNAVVWTNNEKRIRKVKITKKNLLKKEVTKEIKEKYLKLTGLCKNCNCEFQTEKNRIT